MGRRLQKRQQLPLRQGEHRSEDALLVASEVVSKKCARLGNRGLAPVVVTLMVVMVVVLLLQGGMMAVLVVVAVFVVMVVDML